MSNIKNNNSVSKFAAAAVLVGFVFALVASPLVQAQSNSIDSPGNPGNTIDSPGNPGNAVDSPGNPGGNVDSPGNPGGNNLFGVTWNSPLAGGNTQTVEGIITLILDALITIAIPIIVLMIIYAGFLYVTARGNVEQTKRATTALTYAIIGGILVVGAVALTGIIETTLGEFRS